MTARATWPQQLTMDLTLEDSSTPARLGARILAGLIDLVFVALAASAVSQPFPPILVLVVFVVYHATQTWWTGRTVGKALLGLRIVRPGQRLTFGWALARAGPGYLILGLAGLGLATCAFDPRRRSVYDFALGTLVIQETDASFRPQGLLDRFANYAKEHKQAAAERKETIALAGGFWTWLSGLGEWILGLLDRVRGKQATSTGPSVLTVVSSKAATIVAVSASAIATIVLTVVPPAKGVGEWLMTDRYWYGPSDGSAIALAGPEQAIAGWMQRQDQPYVGACPDPATVDDGASSWCTLVVRS